MTEANPETATIFLVDDNAEVAASLERWFSGASSFRWAGWLPGPPGLEDALVRLGPHLVLVDWDLPGTDTRVLLERLTRDFPTTCFAVLSAHLEPAHIRAALEAGARGYLFKGQSPAHLAAEVHLLARGLRVLSAEVQHALATDDEGGT